MGGLYTAHLGIVGWQCKFSNSSGILPGILFYMGIYSRVTCSYSTLRMFLCALVLDLSKAKEYAISGDDSLEQPLPHRNRHSNMKLMLALTMQIL